MLAAALTLFPSKVFDRRPNNTLISKAKSETPTQTNKPNQTIIFKPNITPPPAKLVFVPQSLWTRPIHSTKPLHFLA